MASIFKKRGKLWIRVKDASNQWRDFATGLPVGREAEARKLAEERQAEIRAEPALSWRTDPRRADDLYLIRSSCGHVKIGRAERCQARLLALQATCPPSIALTLIAVAERQGYRELAVHQAFARYRERGEWFSPVLGERLRAMMLARSFLEIVKAIGPALMRTDDDETQPAVE